MGQTDLTVLNIHPEVALVSATSVELESPFGNLPLSIYWFRPNSSLRTNEFFLGNYM